MTLHPNPIPPVPEATAAAVHAAFGYPNGVKATSTLISGQNLGFSTTTASLLTCIRPMDALLRWRHGVWHSCWSCSILRA